MGSLHLHSPLSKRSYDVSGQHETSKEFVHFNRHSSIHGNDGDYISFNKHQETI